jgi:hypothetical protein
MVQMLANVGSLCFSFPSKQKPNQPKVETIPNPIPQEKNMPSTIRLHRVIQAKPQKVYRAFLEPDAVASWSAPS